MDYEGLIRRYFEVRNIMPLEAKQVIEQMKYIESEGNAVRGRHFYYEAQFYYENANLEQCLCHAITGIQHLMDQPYVSEFAKCYNLMGVVYDNKGNDHMQALQYYLEGLDIANKHKDYETSSVFYNNIGCIYDGLHDYATAATYFEQALKNNVKTGGEEFLMEVLNLALIQCEIGDFKQAAYYYDYAETHTELSILEENRAHLGIVKALLAYHDHDIAEVKKQLIQICACGRNGKMNINTFLEVLGQIDALMDKAIIDEFKAALTLLGGIANKLDLLEAKIKIIECGIAFCKMIENDEILYHLLEIYYELARQNEKEKEKMLLEGMNLKLKMRDMKRRQKEIKKKSLKYKKLAQHDALTGLYNRTIFSQKLLPLFEEAKTLEKNVGILIVDINDFKQYNDYYGHVEGDHCIHNIAEIMRSLCNEEIYFVRYGGDEFLGFFYDMEASYIKQIALHLYQEVKKLHIEHDKTKYHEKFVSITIGVYQAVPKDMDDFFEFIAKADNELYRGKNDGTAVNFSTD